MPTRPLVAVCMLTVLMPLLLLGSSAAVRAAGVPPLVGAWIVTVTPTPGPTAPPPSTELTTFTRDGGVLNSNAPVAAAFPALSTGHGVWVSEDDHTFAVTFVHLLFDATGTLVGSAKVLATVTVDETGDALSGVARADIFDPTGALLLSNPATVQATRIVIERLP
jgi:hypothetical protein